MAAPKRTQKEIAQKYRGNLAYLRKWHPFRSLRGAAFVLVALGSVAVAIGYRSFGKKEFFSTGPISSNHQRFADRCEVCHGDADPDLFKALRVDSAAAKAKHAKLSDFTGLLNSIQSPSSKPAGEPAAPAHAGQSRIDLASPAELLTATSTMSRYDAACIQCHEAYQLHQPQVAALGLKSVYNEVALVHAGSCSTCHREHQGPGNMKLPPSNNCSSCHNDPQRLAQGMEMMKTAARLASPRGETRDLGDGVRRFIPPRSSPHTAVAFDAFSTKHPDFGYQQAGLKDPGTIQYNHNRHFQPDVTGVNGRQLACGDCHKAGADGVFMQRVNFEEHCEKCHSLNFDPDTPELKTPHGDPEKVLAYLHSLTSLYRDLGVTKMKITTLPELRTFVEGKLLNLKQQVPDVAALERRVFYQGDIRQSDRITARTNVGQSTPACAKCHEIKPPAIAGPPIVTPTNLADRWLTRGPFTHAPHGHMQCVDCHASALVSSRTSDILLPTKQSCTECHRPLQHATSHPEVAHPEPIRVNEALVARQKQEGGILAECQSCHPKFHAPAEATVYAKDLRKN